MPLIDNPTKSFTEWCAARKVDPKSPNAQRMYQTYKKLNDQLLDQMKVYQGAYEQSAKEGQQISSIYGKPLIDAVSGVGLQDNVNDALERGWTYEGGRKDKFSKHAKLQLSQTGGYYNELKQWMSYFGFINGNAAWKDKQRKKIRATWSQAASPILKQVVVAEGQRKGDVYAKVVQRAPAFDRGVKLILATQGQADKTLSDQIQQSLAIGKYSPTLTGPQGASVTTGATAKPTSSSGLNPLVIIIGLVILAAVIGIVWYFWE